MSLIRHLGEWFGHLSVGEVVIPVDAPAAIGEYSEGGKHFAALTVARLEAFAATYAYLVSFMMVWIHYFLNSSTENFASTGMMKRKHI